MQRKFFVNTPLEKFFWKQKINAKVAMNDEFCAVERFSENSCGNNTEKNFATNTMGFRLIQRSQFENMALNIKKSRF